MRTEIKSNKLSKSFLKFLTAQVFIILAGILLDMVLILFVYQMSQSLFDTSMILVVGSISRILGSILLSNIFDKISAKWIMLGALIAKVFIIIIIILLICTYRYIYLVLISKFLLSLLDSAISPAQGVLLADIIKEDRIRLNGIFYTVIQVFQTATWTFGIPFILFLNPFAAFCVIILMITISLWLLKKIDTKDRVQTNLLPYFERLKQGWYDLFHITELWNITIMDTCESIANVIWTETFLLFFTTSFLNLSEEWWGFQGAAYFVGSIVGGIISIRYSKYISQLGERLSYSHHFWLLFLQVYTLLIK